MANDLENDFENEHSNPPNIPSESVANTNTASASASGDTAGTTGSSNENDSNQIPNEEPRKGKNENDKVALKTDADFFDRIHGLHCPFTWRPEEHLKYRPEEIGAIMNVDEMFEDTGFKLRRFVIHMILCYNNFTKRLIDESIKHLDEMEKMLLTSMKHRSRDVYFTSINDALFHVMQSCRVAMLNETNQKEKALQILKKITPYDDLNDTNKAGIWAIRANLYIEFGYLGVKAAIEYIKTATTIDNKNPYWYFTKGVYLGRLRRLENGLAVPSVDEIAALEFAMKLKEDASFMAFAAEVYTETANRSMKQYQELFHSTKEKQRNELLRQNDLLNQHAAMLFKKSVSLNRGCAHLLFRCGKGMLKLPPPHQDLKLAREYIKEGLEISYESSYGNHAMAMYHEKHEINYEMAKKYLKKASEQKNFGADLDLIRINFFQDQDPEALLNNLLKLFDTYPDKLKHRKIIAEIISYYLFINYNLTEAINYMKKLLYLTGDHDDILKIQIHKSGILRQKLPVSLLEILLSDITDRSNRKKLSEDEQELCKTFLKQLCYQSIDLPTLNRQNLRKKVVSEIKDNFKNLQPKKLERPSANTEKEEPRRKDYNPVENRFNREYAKKYYYDANDENPQKTVVQEFFEQYEREAEQKAKDKAKCESSKDNEKRDRSDGEKKSKDSKEMPSILKEVFSKLKSSKRINLNSSGESDLPSEDEKEAVYRLAKQFERRFDVSSESKSSKDHRSRDKKPRDRSPSSGGSRRESRDDSRSKRHSDSADRKRSISRDSRMSNSRRKRSNSRDDQASHSLAIRSISQESRRSVKSSHKKRSTSRDSRMSNSRKKRSSSRGHESHSSHTKRSLSRESRVSRRKRSTSRESHMSHRKRSASRESHVSTRRKRSVSTESHQSKKSDRHKNHKNDDRNRYLDKTENSSNSEERCNTHRNRSRTRSPSHRRTDDRRKKHDSDQYKSRKSRSYSDTESSRSSSRSPVRSRRKHGHKYDSDDTLTGSAHSHSDGRYKKSDSDDSHRSKSRKHRHDRRKRHDSRRRSKSPARRSGSRESHVSKASHRSHHEDDRYHKRDCEEKYVKRSSKEKYRNSTGSDREVSDRSERSHRSDKSSSHRSRHINGKIEQDHRQLEEVKKKNDGNDTEHSSNRSSREKDLPNSGTEAVDCKPKKLDDAQ